MIEKFKKIFNGLQRAHGCTHVEKKNADGTKLATTMLIVNGDAITGGIAILDFSVYGNRIYEVQ